MTVLYRYFNIQRSPEIVSLNPPAAECTRNNRQAQNIWSVQKKKIKNISYGKFITIFQENIVESCYQDTPGT